MTDDLGDLLAADAPVAQRLHVVARHLAALLHHGECEGEDGPRPGVA